MSCHPVTPVNTSTAEAPMEVMSEPDSPLNLRPQAPNTDRATQPGPQTSQTLQSFQTLPSQQAQQIPEAALAAKVATLEQHFSEVKGWVQKNEENLETCRHNLSETMTTVKGLNDKTEQLTNIVAKLQETGKADTKTINSVKQTLDKHHPA